MLMFDISTPKIMGILNATPDSFSDGGRFETLDTALLHVEKMLQEGVDIIDVGGESTRPGASGVSEQHEIERVAPLIEAIASRFDVLISIDTNKAAVMRASVAAGAGMINDVIALQGDGALAAAADLAVPVCLMHMQGEPRSMQQAPSYTDVISEVVDFLLKRVDACVEAGVARENILLDPGFGFGKNLQHNLDLLNKMPTLVEQGFPVVAGLSRKSMLGLITGKEVDQRLAGSLVVALIALQKGAAILRVHDVAETKDVLSIWQAISRLEKIN